MRIAVVDDEVEMLDHLAGILADAGYRCHAFRRSSDLMHALRRETFDLLILDWIMPPPDGLDITRWVQENVSPLPGIIMWTSRSDKDDIATALTSGADDFIIKPESAVVILSRVEAVLRRTSAAQVPDRFESHGPYRFDRQELAAHLDGERIVLTAKEFDLALMFFRNLNKPLSRSYLLEMVWGSVPELATRTLDMHVSRIRTKLQLRAGNGYLLQTVFGYGYRLETY